MKSDCSKSIAGNINSAPPEMRFGHVLGGWSTRPHETKRSPDDKILIVKFTTHQGKRADLSKFLLSRLPAMEKEEQGTLSVLFIEDAQNENVLYTFERFKSPDGFKEHQRLAKAANVKEKADELTSSVDFGMFKEVMGFLTKDE
jgi:quinol monooxygenase YgiN